MDASPLPRRTLRLLVEICRATESRFEGRMRAQPADPWRSFSGVLELLKVLEELVDDE
jgi:hypothetical protein